MKKLIIAVALVVASRRAGTRSGLPPELQPDPLTNSRNGEPP